MLDSIRSLAELPVSEAVRLAREDIIAARRRHALQIEAQRRARECVEQARHDAQALHAQAFQQGYAEGILRATEHLADGLLKSQALGQQLHNELARAAHDLLAQALSQPQWLDDMLERWLATRATDPSAVLHVLLPRHCHPRGHELRDNLRKQWAGELILEYHSQERYVLRLADQLLEFDVGTVQERLGPRLMASVAGLPDAVRSLDRAASQALANLCSSFADSASTGPGEAHHED